MRRFFWVICIAAGLLLACSRTSQEQRLRAAVTAMQAAVENREPRAFLDHVSADFSGNDGVFDRKGIGDLLRAQLLRNEKIGVALGLIDVQVQHDLATVKVTATLTGGAGGVLPERGAIYAIASHWRIESGTWRCVSATWDQQL